MITMNRRNKLLTIYISFVIFLILLIFLISYVTIIDKEEKMFAQTIANDAERIVSGADSLLSSVDGISFQISMLPALNKLLSSPLEANKFDFMELKDAAGKFVMTNGLFKSVYIYLKPFDSVLTTSEGQFKLSEFYDKEYFDTKENPRKSLNYFIGRKIKGSYYDSGDKNVISLIRDLPIASERFDGRLIINIYESAYFNEIFQSYSSGGTFFIMDSAGVIISHSEKDLIGLKASEIYSLDFENMEVENKKIKVENVLWFAVSKKMRTMGWTLVELVPYEKFEAQVGHTKKVLVSIFLGVAIIAILAAYLLSSFLKKPLKQLVVKMGNYMKELGLEEESDDEYVTFGRAVEKLVNENDRMNKLIKNYAPVIREKFISDLLMGNILNDAEFVQRKDSAGVNFSYDSYFVAVVSVPGLAEEGDSDFKAYVKLFVKSTVEEVFSPDMNAFGNLLDEERLAFIFNFDSATGEEGLRNVLKQKCSEINSFLKEKIQKKAYYSFGAVAKDAEGICESFLQARKYLEYRALSDENDIIFSSIRERDISYPVILQRQILNGIRTLNHEVVKTGVERLFLEYFRENSYSHSKMQQIIIVILSHTIGEFLQNSEGDMCWQDLDLVNNVLECSNTHELKIKTLQMFQMVMEQMRVKMEDQPEDAVYISKVVRYMAENYASDIIVEDIASYVNLNPKYLSRIFKLATGKTLLEHLNQLRIKKAKELFVDHRLSVKEIAAMAGYRDIHSFIRIFKKHEGITPGEYRTLHSGDQHVK